MTEPKHDSPANPFESPVSDSPASIPVEMQPDLNPYVLWGAMLFGVAVEIIQNVQRGNLTDKSLPFLTLSAMDILAGVAAGLGVALLVRAWRHRTFSLLMPGHWFLITACTFVLDALVFLVLYDMLGVDRSVSHLVSDSSQGLCFAGLFIAVSRYSHEPISWRLYSWFWNLVLVLQLFGLVTSLIFTSDAVDPQYFSFVVVPQRFFVVLTLPFLLIGLAGDFFRRRPRDFYHWAGVWLGAVLPLLLFVGAVIAVELLGLR